MWGWELSVSKMEFLQEETMLESDASDGHMPLWMHLVAFIRKFMPCVCYYDRNMHSVSLIWVHEQDGKGGAGNNA